MILIASRYLTSMLLCINSISSSETRKESAKHLSFSPSLLTLSLLPGAFPTPFSNRLFSGSSCEPVQWGGCQSPDTCTVCKKTRKQSKTKRETILMLGFQKPYDKHFDSPLFTLFSPSTMSICNSIHRISVQSVQPLSLVFVQNHETRSLSPNKASTCL